MPTLAEETLPAPLAARLTDEQRQALSEASRGGRLTILARALGMAEQEALAALAAASGLEVASNLEPDPRARGRLPARLVHDYQVIPIRRGSNESEPSEEE